MSAGPQAPLDLSVVVPIFDESESIVALVREIDGVLDGLALRSEILVVDDGSRDDSVAQLTRVQSAHPRLRVVRHATNCGQSAAVATGFRGARGELIATLDGDGQNDPADLPKLLAALPGHDAACGIRRRRMDGWVKRASSRVGNRFRDLVTGDHVQDAGCALRVLRHAALAEVPVFNGMHRFLPTLLRAQGFDVVEVDVGHRPRHAGRSKYGIGNRLWRGIADCLAVRWYRRRAVPGRRVVGAVGEPVRDPVPDPVPDPVRGQTLMLAGLLAVMLASAGCTGAPPDPGPRVPVGLVFEGSRLDPVATGAEPSRADLVLHLEHLAGDELMGRETGSLGGLRAARYIAEVFGQAGLLTTEPIGADDDPLTAGYFQDIGYRGFAVAGLPLLELMDDSAAGPDDPPREAVYGRDFEYVRGGLTDGHFEIVVVRDDETAASLVPRADAALLLLGSRRDVQRWWQLMQAPGGVGWGALLLPGWPTARSPRSDAGHGLARHGDPRPPLELRLHGEWIERLIAAEGGRVRLRLLEGIQLPAYNVVGMLAGVGTPERPELADEVVVISAHYDHLGMRSPDAEVHDGEHGAEAGSDDPHADDLIYNGADDDASGVAFVLELAEALAAGPPPARTLVFLAATGEEHGLLGTRYYLEHPAAPLENTVFNLNFEMVGRPDPAVGPGRLWLTGFERTNLGPELVAAGQDVAADPHPEQNFFMRSDNMAFVRLGVAGQSLSSFGLHADYHQVSDEIATLDFDHMAVALETATAAARLLADGRLDPAWTEGGNPFGERTGTR